MIRKVLNVLGGVCCLSGVAISFWVAFAPSFAGKTFYKEKIGEQRGLSHGSRSLVTTDEFPALDMELTTDMNPIRIGVETLKAVGIKKKVKFKATVQLVDAQGNVAHSSKLSYGANDFDGSTKEGNTWSAKSWSEPFRIKESGRYKVRYKLENTTPSILSYTYLKAERDALVLPEHMGVWGWFAIAVGIILMVVAQKSFVSKK